MRAHAAKKQKQLILERSLKRQRVMMVLVSLSFIGLAGHLFLLETDRHDYLKAQADARHLRTVDVSPIRGPIFDRNSRLLAVSTPVDTLWAEPGVFCVSNKKHWNKLAKIIGSQSSQWRRVCQDKEKSAYRSTFMYLKRQLPPEMAERALAQKVPGVHARRDYKRFYPTGPTSSHMIGFVDIDNQGQEGVEKLYNQDLQGIKGSKKVLRDSKGRFVEIVEQNKRVEDGETLKLSLDSRLQYLASGYLEQAVRKNKAKSGSVVLLAIPSGEVLAVVNSPQFNPNDRAALKPDRFRNRAVSDVHEPGSTIKPFTIAMALESGRYKSTSLVDTGQKPFKIRGGTIHDTKPHGIISLSDVVKMSSNIGSAKLALAFEPEDLFQTLDQVGFGHKNGGIMAEVRGSVPKREREIDRATQSYGHGMNATVLQLARAYTAFATDGRVLPLTIKANQDEPSGQRVFSKGTAKAVRRMLEKVVSEKDGTAKLARIPRYRVGGKTGTSHKLINGSYKNKRYVSWFVGLAPISDPEFVLAVMVDDPRGEDYYGGSVAGPVFAKLMKDALRLYNVAPDAAAIKISGQLAAKNELAQGGGA